MSEDAGGIDAFISKIEELSTDAPMTIIKLPPKTVGLPVGSYNVMVLLLIIAECLRGHEPQCLKGAKDGKQKKKKIH